MGSINNPKKMLITGATGFLGSCLARRFVDYYNVVIIKRSFSDIRRIKDIYDDLIVYDIDKIKLNQIFYENKIDIIVHTATSYGRRKESLEQIVSTNVLFPLKLLELGILYKVNQFVNTDTAAVSNLNPYALSKNHFLDWLKIKSTDIDVVNIKLEHFYGPNDDKSKFITYLIKKMILNETIDLTSGMQKRDFIYIDDVVNAYFIILKSNTIKDNYIEFELGSGNQISIKDIVIKIHELVKSKSRLNFGAISYRNNEIMTSNSDISKLIDLGWKPMVSLTDGLLTTIKESL